jgi:outer membrane immunogenic protein
VVVDWEAAPYGPGWTAGGGVEWLFLPNWSLKVEYLYYDLGRVIFGLSPLTISSPSTLGPITNNLPRAIQAVGRLYANPILGGLDHHYVRI